MKNIALGAALTLMTTVGALGGDVPFAAPTGPHPGQVDTSLMVSLGDIMSVTQLRHIKLWYAGQSGNWELVSYVDDQINESLRRAALLYTNIPVEYIVAASAALNGMRDAVASKSTENFVRSYSELTLACNSCHLAGHVGFIRIQTPTSSPFGDEIMPNK
jgi:hypothetical protein